MPSPIVYRSLATIHDSMKNDTGSIDNSTTPAATPSSSHQMTAHSHKRLLSGLLVALNVLLILLLYFYFYKFFFRKCPSSSNSHHRSTATTGTPDSSPPSSPRGGRALELHVINSIPIIEFKSIGEEKAECSVCLVEFTDGDKTRVLPRCSHQFHVECVDTWFRSHANCPFCRTPVEEKAGAGSESMV